LYSHDFDDENAHFPYFFVANKKAAYLNGSSVEQFILFGKKE
jgi:hypothetical protein